MHELPGRALSAAGTRSGWAVLTFCAYSRVLQLYVDAASGNKMTKTNIILTNQRRCEGVYLSLLLVKSSY